MAATIAAPATAQTLQKSKLNRAPVRTVAVEAQTKPARTVGKDGKGIELPRIKKQSKGIRQARKAGYVPVQAPAAAPADVPIINGSIIYSNAWTTAAEGLYRVPRSAAENPELLFLGPDANYGGVCVDDYYYSTMAFSMFGYVFITVDVYDVNTGELVTSLSPDDPAVVGSAGYALDPSSGSVYGITYDSNMEGLQLSKLTFTPDEVTAEAIGVLEGRWNCIAIDSSGQIYGITYDGEIVDEEFEVQGSTLYKIDKTDASVTAVGETGALPLYMSSAVIDPKTDRMFWNVNPPDDRSYMYEVNLATGEATLLYEIATGDEILGMYMPAVPNDGAPGECQNVAPHFYEGSLSGTITLKAPATTFDGKPGTGNVDIKVLLDGDEVASQSAAYGADVTVNVTAPTGGSYMITVYASNSEGDGPKTYIKNYWIGSDTPEATKATLAYQNGNMEVTWNAITSSVNGGYIDISAIRYNVKRSDGTYAVQGITATSFSEEIEEPTEVTAYYYIVEVVCNGLYSEPARTNTIVLGSIVPPYTWDIAEDGLYGFTVVDSNNDGKVWSAQADGTIKMSYNTDEDMDDWLITPAISVEKGLAYIVSFDVWAQSTAYVERIEVKYGKSDKPASLTSTLLEPTDLTVAEANKLHVNKMLVPDATGKIYIGFHGISDADMYVLNLANISIAAGASTDAPVAVTGLEAVPDENGANSVTLTFTAPDKTVGGEDLTSIDKIEILRGDEVVNTISNPAPGASLSYTDAVPSRGDYTYSVVAYNEAGAGFASTVDVFVGFKAPATPTGATIKRTSTEGQVVVSWDAVTTDVLGRVYPSGSVTYSVYEYDDYGATLIADNLKSTTYSYQAVAEGEQNFVQCMIAATYDSSTGQGEITDMIPVGTPYAGLSESFPDGTLNYIWALRSIQGGSVSLMDDDTFDDLKSVDGDGGFIAITGNYIGMGADFISGLVSLDRLSNPALSFYVYNIVASGADVNEISVDVRAIDGGNEGEWVNVLESTTVAELVGEGVAGWGKVRVPLNAFTDKVIQFRITGLIQAYQYIPIDNIKVATTPAYDLAALYLTAPASVRTGEDYTVDVTVSNEGYEDVDSFQVELYMDEELVATETLGEIKSGERMVVPFERSMSPVAVEPVTYFAKVILPGDKDSTNDLTSSVTVAPIASILPGPTDLEAANEAEGVKLNWTAPDLEGGVGMPVTEDFEDAEAFSDEYGEWTFADLDGSPVGGFQNMDLPGINPGETTGSFWIWDQTDGIGNSTFDAHSGKKYLFSLFRFDDGLADEWAISPELSGRAQTVTFYAKSYSSSYPEMIKVMYTTSSSTDPNDYSVAMAKTEVPGDWTLFEAELPAGATHFAIVSCAEGSFMLMVDDVTYIPGDSDVTLEIEGYNIYRDGVKINDAPVTETEYLDANVTDGTRYTYVVTAVYKEVGESAISNEAVITYTFSGLALTGDGSVKVTVDGGNIVVLNAGGMEISVVTADGKVIFNGIGESRTVVAAGTGIYAVRAGRTSCKVTVR